MSLDITLTESASTYIKKMIEKNHGVGFRVTIKKTGCSGYSYLPSVIESVNAADLSFKTANDVTIYIDATWLHLLEGIHIDFIEEDKSGLKQKRLVFTNPNESSRCGCGESFHVE